jgi:AcrR family transcriptional regulator
VRTSDGDAIGRGLSRIDRRRTEARKQPSESYLRRRRELELAAASVMRRKGFHDMTLRDIADEIGGDRATIYYYVAGKEELLADMVLHALLENQESFAEIAQHTGPAADKIRSCIRVLMEQFDRHFPYLYIWVHQDLSRFEGIKQAELDRLIDLSQGEFEFVERLIRDGIASGELESPLPAGIVAQSIIGLVAWTYRWYEPGHRLTAGRLADGLADMVLRGLRDTTGGPRPIARRPRGTPVPADREHR